MSLDLCRTCLAHLSPTLGALVFGALGCMGLHLSSTRFPHLSPTHVSHLFPTLVPHLFRTLVSHSGCLGPYEFRLVSHLSRTLVSDSGCSGSWCFGLYEFTLVFHLSPILVSHLFPTHVSHTCLPHLSATLVSHTVSHTCLPHLSPTLVSHFGCLGLYELTLASHLSPTLGCAVKTCREGCRNDTRCRKMTCNWFFFTSVCGQRWYNYDVS